MTAEELGDGMHDDVGAMLQRADEVGARHGVVDDQRQTVAVGDLGDGLDVDKGAAGIGKALDVDGLGLVIDLGGEAFRVGGIGPADLPAEVLEGMAELVDRAAIELFRRDEVIARLHQGVEDQELCGVARGDG